jgi:hypothetical protein
MTNDRARSALMTALWTLKLIGKFAAALSVLTVGLLSVGTGAAWAGSNGQQINYYSHDAIGQCTEGNNQDGQNVRSCTTFDKTGGNTDEGHWWVGPVNITWNRVAGGPVRSTCNVPRRQSADFYTCYEPR